MSTYCRRTVELTGDLVEHCPADRGRLADAALAVITTAMHDPPRPEVIVLVLDTDLGGHAVVIVDGTDSPDAVIEVVELLAEGAAEAAQPGDVRRRRRPARIWATARRRRPLAGARARSPRRTAASSSTGSSFSDDVAWCPRDLLAEPPRWP